MLLDENVVERVMGQFAEAAAEDDRKFVNDGFEHLEKTSPVVAKVVQRLTQTMLEEAGGIEANMPAADAAFYLFWLAFTIAEANNDPSCRTAPSAN